MNSKNDNELSFHEEDRVPLALQAVFLASNRGKEVHQPPPDKLAAKTFRRKSIWQKLQSPIRSPLRRSKGSLPNVVNAVPSAPISPETPRHQISPEAYLKSTVLARGYSNKEFSALKTGYFSQPTAHQKASYGGSVVRLVREGDTRGLRKMLDAGISPNAANSHGETILHMVCRAGRVDCFRLLMSFGANVQVSDSCGRTPLHSSCWTDDPSLDIIEMILDEDPRLLFVTDSCGSTPLSYVRPEKWTMLTRFLMSRKDKYWPDRDFEKLGSEKDPELALVPPNSTHIVNRRPDVSLSMITAIAQGSLPPPSLSDSIKSAGSMTSTEMSSESSDSDYMEEEYLEVEDGDSEFSDSDSEDDGDDDDGEDDSSVNSFVSFDEGEMKNILNSIGGNKMLQWCK